MFEDERKNEPKWKEGMKDVGNNPNYIYQPIEGLITELRHDKPSAVYLREKVRAIFIWVEEIIKFGSPDPEAIENLKAHEKAERED